MRNYTQFSGRGHRIRLARGERCGACGAEKTPLGFRVGPGGTEYTCPFCHATTRSVELELLAVAE